MTLKPADIEAKVFSVVRLGQGYAKHEVDDFLDKVRDELDRAQNVARAAKEEVSRLLSSADRGATQLIPMQAGGPSSAGSATVTLVTAAAPVEASITKILQRGQQLADEGIAEAKVEAERLKAEAQVEIDKLKADAEAEVAALRADAAAKVAEAQQAADALASANSTTAKILQNALALLSPAVPPAV